jgi:type VI secretion system secreted protein VgrG
MFRTGKSDYAYNFTAVPHEGDVQPMPLPAATKPIAYGPHLATVIGPDPVPSITDAQHVVHADRLGRVRVRFPWAPEGYIFADDNPACWVRVSQGWASQGYGSQFLPRIGDEVVVEFLNGDPDRPLITGRVYNADKGPSNLAFASPGTETTQLTADDLVKPKTGTFTRGGIRTRILPPGDQTGFHMFRLDDSPEGEHTQTLLRSQGRLDITSFNSTYSTTNGNRHVRVVPAKDKHGGQVGGSGFLTVAGEYDFHVGGNRYDKVDKNYQLSVKANTQLDLKGDCFAVVGGALSVNASTIVMEAKTKLTLKVGCSTIVLNAGGIYLDAPMIYKQCSGPADQAKDLNMVDIADATQADPGDPPNWLDQHGGGKGGGQRGQQSVPAQHGPDCTLDNEHHICVNLQQLCGKL